MLSAHSSGTMVIDVASAPSTNSLGSGMFNLSMPNTSPAAHDPRAYIDSTMLAAAGWP